MNIKIFMRLLIVAFSLALSSCASFKGELETSNVYRVVKIQRAPDSRTCRVTLKQKGLRYTLLCDTSNYFSYGNKIQLGHKYKLNLYCVYPCATINGVEIHPSGLFGEFLFRAKNMDGLYVNDEQCNCMSYYHAVAKQYPDIDTLLVKNLLSSIDENCFAKNPCVEDSIVRLVIRINESYPQVLNEVCKELLAPQQQFIQKILLNEVSPLELPQDSTKESNR